MGEWAGGRNTGTFIGTIILANGTHKIRVIINLHQNTILNQGLSERGLSKILGFQENSRVAKQIQDAQGWPKTTPIMSKVHEEIGNHIEVLQELHSNLKQNPIVSYDILETCIISRGIWYVIKKSCNFKGHHRTSMNKNMRCCHLFRRCWPQSPRMLPTGKTQHQVCEGKIHFAYYEQCSDCNNGNVLSELELHLDTDIFLSCDSRLSSGTNCSDSTSDSESLLICSHNFQMKTRNTYNKPCFNLTLLLPFWEYVYPLKGLLAQHAS